MKDKKCIGDKYLTITKIKTTKNKEEEEESNKKDNWAQ